MLLAGVACSPITHPDEQRDEIAKKLFESFNQHNWKAMADLYSDSAVFLDPAFGKSSVVKTRAETIAKYSEMQTMFPDVHDQVKNMYSCDEVITVEFVSTGTAPDGTTFSLPIVSILTIRNGLIIKDATYYDL